MLTAPPGNFAPVSVTYKIFAIPLIERCQVMTAFWQAQLELGILSIRREHKWEQTKIRT